MRAHYLQHVAFEGLGSIEPWLENAGYHISKTQFFDSHVLPDVDDIDLLIVMGGPMSVNDEAQFPWLVEEKHFIKQMIEAKKPVLGICLGAQLIASAMGAGVSANSDKEIGWFPVESVESDNACAFKFPKQVDVFHWHGETFALPEGAVLLAKSSGCKNQAFQLGSHVIGLQFHLETTPDSAKTIVEHCADELVFGKYIQSESEILSAPSERYTSINSLMASILDYLHATKT